MSGTPRTVEIAEHLWDALETMAQEMGVDRDMLVNQAVFTLARLNGYVVPGRLGAPAAPELPAPAPRAKPQPAPEPEPEAHEEEPPAPEPEAAPEPPKAKTPDRVRAINAQVDRQVRVPARAKPAPEPEPEPEEQEEAQAPAPSDEEPAEEKAPEGSEFDEEPSEEAQEPQSEFGEEPSEDETPAPAAEEEPEPEPEPVAEEEQAAPPEEDFDDLPPDAKTMAKSMEDIESHTGESEAPEEAPEEEAEESVELYLQVEGAEPVMVANDRFLMGRGKHCDLVLLSNRVSREHAVILRDGADIVLEDLGSSNGTWMDEQRITKRPLLDGDVFMLGNIRIRCDFGRPKA